MHAAQTAPTRANPVAYPPTLSLQPSLGCLAVEGDDFEPRARGKKRGRKRGDGEGSVDGGDAPRRNLVSSRINYDVVQILSSQAMEEDADLMPNSPGPVAIAGFTAAAGDTFSETLSVHSSMGHGTDDEPAY
jgi:hypothetical protein